MLTLGRYFVKHFPNLISLKLCINPMKQILLSPLFTDEENVFQGKVCIPTCTTRSL